MDRLEMLRNLEEETNLERFFGRCLALEGKAPSFHFGRNPAITLPMDVPEEIVMFSSHPYLWNADKTCIAHLGDPRFENHLYRKQIASGAENELSITRLPKHLRAYDISLDFIRFIYVLRGAVKFEFKGEDVLLKNGNAILISPRTFHHHSYVGADSVALHIAIFKNVLEKYFSYIFTDAGALGSFLGSASFTNPSDDYLIVNAPPDERLRSLALDMLIDQENRRAFGDRVISRSLEAFLHRMALEYGSCIIRKDKSEKAGTASMIVDYMRRNYASLSMDELSQRLFLSSSYISRILKQRFGRNYIQMLTDIRMRKAQELLAVQSLSIESVSQMIGYGNARQFRRVFKETYDITPSEYRVMVDRQRS